MLKRIDPILANFDPELGDLALAVADERHQAFRDPRLDGIFILFWDLPWKNFDGCNFTLEARKITSYASTQKIGAVGSKYAYGAF